MGENYSLIPILIQPVNDAPFFISGEDIEIDEDAGLQVFSDWVTDISAGAENESKQKLQFIISNDNPELFTPEGQPNINPQGILTFETVANGNGVATVTVKLKDNGGIENGGVDTSAEQTFTITVKPVNDPPLNNIPTVPLTMLEDGKLTFKVQTTVAGRLTLSRPTDNALFVSTIVTKSRPQRTLL